MKLLSIAPRSVLASLLALPMASVMAGGAASSGYLQRNDDEDGPLNRFSLNYSMGMNITASFKNVRMAPNYYSVPNQQGVLTPTAVNPGSTSGAGSHVYNDGYVQTDASGNALGYSSYWGYQNASQVRNNTMVMNATTPTLGAGPQNLNGDPQHGFEFAYQRQLGRHGQLRWGLEAAFGFTDVTIRDQQSVAGNYTLTSDAYALPPVPGGGVVIPPSPPYRGPYSAPPGSPLLGATPSRTLTPVASLDEFNLDAHVFRWRLGPYLQVPVIKQRLDFTLSGGLAVLYVNSQFSYQESVPMPGLSPQLNSGSGSHNDLLLGGYVGGDLSLRLTRSVDLFTGVQYLKAGNATNTQNGKQAQINFGNSLFVPLGLSYKF